MSGPSKRASIAPSIKPPDPLLSRPSEASPFGKSDARIDVACASAFKDALRQLASLEGLTEAAYARRVLETHVILERERLTRMVEHLGGAVMWTKRPADE
jgi:hypothetical protein